MDANLAYANFDFTPGAAEAHDDLVGRSAEFRALQATLGRARLNLAYGAHPREALDLFLPTGRPHGLLVFIHGGFWRGSGREEWSVHAAGAMERDWAVAMPSYPLAPEVEIPAITASVGHAVDHAASLVPTAPIAITGHSAGGHLAARMASKDLPLNCRPRIKRIVPISPVSDLRPLLGTDMNADLRLTGAIAAAESPVLNAKASDTDCRVVVGAEERPAFLDQARWLAAAWNCAQQVLPGRHHFDILDDLEDPDSGLVRWLCGAA